MQWPCATCGEMNCANLQLTLYRSKGVIVGARAKAKFDTLTCRSSDVDPEEATHVACMSLERGLQGLREAADQWFYNVRC